MELQKEFDSLKKNKYQHSPVEQREVDDFLQSLENQVNQIQKN